MKSFGSFWSWRAGREPSDPKRYIRAAYYNTTGIRIGEQIRHRWRVGGDLRFYGVGCGFNPNHPGRSLNQTFECHDPELWYEHNRIAVKRLVKTSPRPDYFLIVVTADQTGGVVMDNDLWRAGEVVLVSFSEWKDRQEIMLLMPAYSWVRGRLGTFFVEPSLNRDLNGELRLDPC